MRIRRIRLAAFVALSLLAFGPAAHSAQRTFVSTSGDDANACTLTAPCRTFTRAIAVTDPNGELIVLDSGGYGAVTISQNVKIVSPAGVYAGISVFAGSDGVTVAAPASLVVLRGLTINGQGGTYGIRVQSGNVHIEDVVISGLAAGVLVEGGTSVRISGCVMRSNTDGLRVLPTTGAVSVHVRDSEFSDNGQIGMRISPSGAGNSAVVTVERTTVTRSSGYGIYSGPGGGGAATIVVTQSVLSEHAIAGVASEASGATVWVRESAVTRNGTGLRQVGLGVLNACGANLLVANTTPTSGTINTSSCLDVAAGTGTVTSVGTGTGLTGGPITTTGTISADTAYLQRRVSGTCGTGSSIRTINADGTVVCEADDVGTGTVTSVGTGTGLTGGPITGAGTVSIANGGVGTAQLANASVNVAKLDTASTDARYFKQYGNSLGTGAVLGTLDNQVLELRVHDNAGLRIEPTVADPANNYFTATPNVIGGWNVNGAYAGVLGATIGGGGGQGLGLAANVVTDHYGTVGGGFGNIAGDALGTVRDRAFATVGGGAGNTASGDSSTVGGGQLNTASKYMTTVGGGLGNDASANYGTVSGGLGNTASGDHSTIGGGWNNSASGNDSTIGGGLSNSAGGNYSVVPGGHNNVADGTDSFAAGYRAKALHAGAFVWADSSNFDFASVGPDTFRVRATNGMRVVTEIDGTGAMTWSCLAVAGASWSCASDRNLKHSLVQLDGRAVLAKLAAVPMYQWQPKGANAHVKHIGPMAQDFHAAFGVGDDDRMIGMQDADGVALAAIQGLHAELRDRDATIAELRDRLARLESLRGELATLRTALAHAVAGKAFVARE